jgi:N-methylhydantoinase A
MKTVIVPRAPGLFSAFGMLFSDLRYDFVRTWFTRLAEAPFDQIEKIYKELEDEGRDAIKNTSVSPSEITVKRAADMRYVGQEHAVTVDLPIEVFAKADRAAIKKHFDDMHELRYGTCAPEEQAEIVSLRTTVTGVMAKPPQEKVPKGKAEPEKAAFTGNRKVFFQGGFLDTPTYARAALLAGNKLKGPALIEEHASTTVVMPGDEVDIDDFGNIVIAVGGRR